MGVTRDECPIHRTKPQGALSCRQLTEQESENPGFNCFIVEGPASLEWLMNRLIYTAVKSGLSATGFARKGGRLGVIVGRHMNSEGDMAEEVLCSVIEHVEREPYEPEEIRRDGLAVIQPNHAG